MNVKNIFLVPLVVLLFKNSYAQSDTINTQYPKAVVFSNTELYAQLKDYLLRHPTVFAINSNGKPVPYTQAELKEQYEGVGISSQNLKTDSTYFDKSGVGIYKFGYMDLSEPKWLYLKYEGYIEFLDLNKKNFNLDKLLRQIRRFFKKNPSLTEKEKVKMLKGAMEVIYSNLYEVYSF